MRCIFSLAIVIACAAAPSAPAWAAAVARVEFSNGNVMAVDRAGQPRPLAKGAQIDEGDTVHTRAGRAQLRFSDGALVSLQPQSLFRIDEYRFNGKQDGNERGFFSLLQGGMRTITGLVGRTNKRNYQVSTAVATIGIRGTEYTVNYGGSVSGAVGEGEIVVCNGGGCLDVTNGESYYVASADIRPVMTGKKTDLTPPQPPAALPSFVKNDDTTSEGLPAGLIDAQPAVAMVDPLLGTQKLTLTDASTSYSNNVFPAVIVSFDAAGAVTKIGSATIGNVVESGNNGVIAWGRGMDANGYFWHYVTGTGTPASALSTLAIGRTVATYTMIGHTTPTAGNASAMVTGTLNSASLVADFGTSTVSASVNVTIGGINFVAQSPGMAIQSGNGALVFDCDNPPITHPCINCSYVTMRGMFAGPDAKYAGLTYVVDAQDSRVPALPGKVAGSVTFAR
jgi:FecR protein